LSNLVWSKLQDVVGNISNIILSTKMRFTFTYIYFKFNLSLIDIKYSLIIIIIIIIIYYKYILTYLLFLKG